MLPEIFGWNDPKSRFPFTFQLGFRETFCDGKQLRDGPLEIISNKFIFTIMFLSTYLSWLIRFICAIHYI